ncbi:hypothetical protein PACTADRAFT_32960 [Pachysolen tannophilus NRRL Y-2460]|uniref:amidase n=1 Tax=Pachysolen tannophilus NRRL Y-2460 TaxID=669874 RepID=A0A1E4TVH1_PACTA|nr:hypothetical protein PACTADRAFT_32960 [Pachysolen tannophilus NRRL Y-2460]
MLWEEVAQLKRDSNLGKIRKEWLLDEIPSVDEVGDVSQYLDLCLPSEEVGITSKTAVELVDCISKGKLTAYKVTEVFCHRAALIHQMTNCLSEIFFDKALARAKELDDYFEKRGTTVGPLHGLPISLKDQVNLKGVETSIGYVAPFINDEYMKEITGNSAGIDKESLIAKLLADAGAVFYVKTTVPMAMLGYDTSSNLFGQTLNSLNRKLSCGGSSGGEGSLIGASGSKVGLGTDIGGSIRTPSAFQGLFGLRPSSNRLPYLGVANSMADQPVICSVIGPMAQDLQDLKLITKCIIDSRPWEIDPKVPPLPWREFKIQDSPNPKFIFGIMEWDRVIFPHPPFIRALQLIKQALLSQGHQVFNFEPPMDHNLLLNLLTSIFTADALQEIKTNCAKSGEPLNSLIQRSFDAPSEPISVIDHWKQAKLKYEYQQVYDRAWTQPSKSADLETELDCFIAPAWCSTSFIAGENLRSPSTYTRFLNVLDYTVIVVPVTKVDKILDKPFEHYSPISEKDEINYKNYDPELMHGMPVCIQLVCKRYQEEKAIALAELLVDALDKL